MPESRIENRVSRIVIVGRCRVSHALSGETAKRVGKPIGICGRAPSDHPDLAEWLVECGIDSISLNPDTAIKTAFVIAKAEAREQRRSLPRMNARPAIAD